MSGPAHTPGPWTVNADGYHVEASGVVVAGVFGSQAVRSVREECNANARLIAQAPALAEALRRCLELLGEIRRLKDHSLVDDNMENIIGPARAALAQIGEGK